MNDFLDSLYAESLDFGYLEIIGVSTALVYVALAAKGNRWCFLFGLISSLIYVYLSYILKFYFDFGINLYYVAMSFYGWIAWSENQNNNSEIVVRTYPSKKLLLIMAIGVLITAGLATLANRFSDAALPHLDAFTTVFSILATYLVVKKYIQNWLIWIVVDAVACYMYFYKELYLTAVLFFIYTIIAIVGYFKWEKLIIKNS